jgi:hypothetical protein
LDATCAFKSSIDVAKLGDAVDARRVVLLLCDCACESCLLSDSTSAFCATSAPNSMFDQ